MNHCLAVYRPGIRARVQTTERLMSIGEVVMPKTLVYVSDISDQDRAQMPAVRHGTNRQVSKNSRTPYIFACAHITRPNPPAPPHSHPQKYSKPGNSPAASRYR